MEERRDKGERSGFADVGFRRVTCDVSMTSVALKISPACRSLERVTSNQIELM